MKIREGHCQLTAHDDQKQLLFLVGMIFFNHVSSLTVSSSIRLIINFHPDFHSVNTD